jgi:hypothetical protein
MEATTRTPDQIVSQLVPLLHEAGPDLGLPRNPAEVAKLCIRQAALIAKAESDTGREVHAVVEADEDVADVAQRLFGGLEWHDGTYRVRQGEATYDVPSEYCTVNPPRVVTLDITAANWHPEAIAINSLTVGVDVVLRVLSDETVNGRRLVVCEYEIE